MGAHYQAKHVHALGSREEKSLRIKKLEVLEVQKAFKDLRSITCYPESGHVGEDNRQIPKIDRRGKCTSGSYFLLFSRTYAVSGVIP